jgi:hypothetical protein
VKTRFNIFFSHKVNLCRYTVEARERRALERLAVGHCTSNQVGP